MQGPHPSVVHAFSGYTLLELVLALALTALLLLGLVQITAAAGTSARLQDAQAQLQENARLAQSTLSQAIRQAGYNPEPWSGRFPALPRVSGSVDSLSRYSDRLILSAWSDLNCYGHLNADTDAQGRPRFYLRETSFDLNTSRNLTQACRYGPDAGSLVDQIHRQGFVPGVEAFQVQYGQDIDGDGLLENWVRAGNWGGDDDILGVRIGLLLAGDESVAPPQSRVFEVLDLPVRKRADGRLRRIADFTTALRGASG